MSLTLLKTLFKIGKFLAITPHNFKKPTIFEIFFGFCVISFHTATSIISTIYRIPDYSHYIHIRLTIHVILTTSMYLFSIVVICIGVLQRQKWYRLFKILKLTQNSPEKTTYFSLIFSNLIFLLMSAYINVCFTQVTGPKFLGKHLVTFPQLYVQFFTTFLIYTILKIVKMRYKVLGKILKKYKRGNKIILKKVCYDYIFLKETVEIFNEIFGWPILLLTIHSSLQIVVYPSDTLVSTNLVFIFSAIFVLVLFCVSRTCTIEKINNRNFRVAPL